MPDKAPIRVPTLGLLSITDGRLMSAVRDVYKTLEPMAGRSVWTHELPSLADRFMASGLAADLPPAFQPQNTEPLSFTEARDAALASHGDSIELPGKFRNCLRRKETPDADA